MQKLKDSFLKLKKATLRATESLKIEVSELIDNIYLLVSDAPVPDVKCVQEMANFLRASKTIEIVYDHISLHWDYLHPDLYGELIRIFNLCKANPDLTEMFKLYNLSLNRFLDETPLNIFCEVSKTKKQPAFIPEVKKVVVKNQWEEPVTLRKVEKLRQETAIKCKLQQCAVIVVDIVTGCYMTTMVVPASVELRFSSLATDHEYIRAHEIIAIFFHDTLIYPRGHISLTRSRHQQGNLIYYLQV